MKTFSLSMGHPGMVLFVFFFAQSGNPTHLAFPPITSLWKELEGAYKNTKNRKLQKKKKITSQDKHKSRLRIKGQGRRGRVTCLHASSSQILLPRDWGLFGEYLGLLLTWPPSLSGQHLAFMSLVLFI